MYYSWKKQDNAIILRRCTSQHNHCRLSNTEILNTLKISDIADGIKNRAYELYTKGEDPVDIYPRLQEEYQEYLILQLLINIF